MQNFKPLDCLIQVLLLVGSLVYSLFFKNFGDLFLASYFVVGGWQMISVLVHALSSASYRIPARKIYLWILLVTVVSTGIVIGLSMSGSGDFLIMWLFGILFWTAAMAIFYFIICILETQKMKKAILQEAAEPPLPIEETV